MAVPSYYSTRDPTKKRYAFSEALLYGLAPDGGLFVPDQIPQFREEASQISSFSDLGITVLRPWLAGELAVETLEQYVREALPFEVPLVPLTGPWDGIYVVELFHGPTHSFKDFGARTMARLMAHFAREKGRRLTVLVATSGDTGSAVADGFAGLEGLQVALLFPSGQVSPVQEMQLAVKRNGVRSFKVEGTFDDCQRMVKEAFLDAHLASLGLTSANSINIGRLLPQMLYYHWAIRSVAPYAPVICVPSGNLGNLTAGMMAQASGRQVESFIAAHNSNRFFPEFLGGANPEFRPSIQTLSNAMDVGAPSNFERMTAIFGEKELRTRVRGQSVTDKTTLDTVKEVYETTGYIADPHTAVGLHAVKMYRGSTGSTAPALVMGTAHPAKFPETTRAAIGVKPHIPAALERLQKRERSVESLMPTLESLREALLEQPVF